MIVALAWLGRRALESRGATWTRSPAEWILLGAVLLVVAQLIPWPQSVLDLLSPHTRHLLPLWRGDADRPGHAGHLEPGLDDAGVDPGRPGAAVGLWHAVPGGGAAAARRSTTSHWLLRWIGGAVVVQAVFGIVQYLTANGKFVWIYQHPFRDTVRRGDRGLHQQESLRPPDGPGPGPLGLPGGRLGSQRNRPDGQSGFKSGGRTRRSKSNRSLWMLALGVVLLAGLMTFSRGGALAMVVDRARWSCAALFRAGLLSWRFVGGQRRRRGADRRQPGDSRLSAGRRPPRRLHRRLDPGSRPRTAAAGRFGTPISRPCPITAGSARASAAIAKSIRCI